MGEVWRALKVGNTRTDWSRQVALKVILPGFAERENFVELFTTEARIAAGLTHANIVSVSGFGIEENVLYLEQELIDGSDLARLMNRTPGGFPVVLAQFVVIEALKGLAYAHHHQTPDGRPQSVIHRDIKPANVLVAREGHVKLADFGVAKITSGDPSLTELRGTIGYLAPELLEGKPPSVRSDLFAAGVILWELFTGTRLFSGENEAAKLMKTYETVIPPLADLGIACPPQVEAIMRRMLARDPAARYASADEAMRDLLEAPGGRSATSVDLKAFLTSLGVEGLPSIDTPGLTRERKIVPKTLTAAGELSHGKGPAAEAAAADPLSMPPARRAPTSKRAAIAVIAALGLAGGVIALAVRPSSSKSPAATAPPPVAVTASPGPAPSAAPAPAAPVATPPAPAPAPAPVAAAPVPDAGPKLSRVTLEVTPAGATVTVDGQPLAGPPFVVEAPRGKSIAVHVEKAGFGPVERTIEVADGASTEKVALVEVPKTAGKNRNLRNSKPPSPRSKQDGLLLPEEEP